MALFGILFSLFKLRLMKVQYKIIGNVRFRKIRKVDKESQSLTHVRKTKILIYINIDELKHFFHKLRSQNHH